MPIRNLDPFADPFSRMNPEYNAFLSILRENDLPLFYGPKLQPWTGRWREFFQDRMPKPPQKLVLEIGSHFGEVILKMAADRPDIAFLGMDITLKRVVKLAQKAEANGLKNLASMLCNARGLEQIFAPSEIDTVLVFFPDPWAKKKRQLKNRLLGPDFLPLLASRMKNEGTFWFKTDHQGYFEEVCALLTEQGWRPAQPEGLTAEIYTSRFERLFRDRGLPTYESLWQPPLANPVLH